MGMLMMMLMMVLRLKMMQMKTVEDLNVVFFYSFLLSNLIEVSQEVLPLEEEEGEEEEELKEGEEW
jgi:hypothetical protein